MDIDTPPSCRAAIRGRTVTLNAWRPGMAVRGPARAGLGHVRAALADLRRQGGELIITPVPGVPWHEHAERALLAWAEQVGHRRVWLPGRVVDLGHALPRLGRAHVTCPTCGAQWEDGSVEFWEDVRSAGWFPGLCLACGASLPEWTLEPRTSGRDADSPTFADADLPATATGARSDAPAARPGRLRGVPRDDRTMQKGLR